MARKEMSVFVSPNDKGEYEEFEVVDQKARDTKQDKLVSGTNIKTINRETIVGNGNIVTLTPDQLGTPNGVAQLDKDGFIDSSQIPGTLDEIIEGSYINETTFNDINGKPVVPRKDKIYYDINTLKRYGWGGSKFVEFSGTGLIVGEIAGTAYDGAKGKANADNIKNLQDNKLDKVSEQEKVYATDNFGHQITVQYNTEPYGDGLARRTSDGRIKAETPTEEKDLVNLKYFNENKGGTISQATDTTLGGVKASPKTDDDTQEVHIDPASGKLFTKAGGGGAGGVSYKEIVTDPILGVWVVKHGKTQLSQLAKENMTFTSKGQTFTSIECTFEFQTGSSYYNLFYDSTEVFNTRSKPKWVSELYETIEITDVSKVNDKEKLLAFLQRLATKE